MTTGLGENRTNLFHWHGKSQDVIVRSYLFPSTLKIVPINGCCDTQHVTQSALVRGQSVLKKGALLDAEPNCGQNPRN